MDAFAASVGTNVIIQDTTLEMRRKAVLGNLPGIALRTRPVDGACRLRRCIDVKRRDGGRTENAGRSCGGHPVGVRAERDRRRGRADPLRRSRTVEIRRVTA